MRASWGEVEISTPRGGQGGFQPKEDPKRSKNLSKDIERQIMTLYAGGSSLGEIRGFLEEMYDVEASPLAISRITDKIILLLDEYLDQPAKLRFRQHSNCFCR